MPDLHLASPNVRRVRRATLAVTGTLLDSEYKKNKTWKIKRMKKHTKFGPASSPPYVLRVDALIESAAMPVLETPLRRE